MTRTGDGSQPLAGTRILVPRARDQAPALSRRILAAGGQPVEAPVLVIGSGDASGLDRAVAQLADGGFHGVCFTSPNGVRGVAGAIRRADRSPAVVRTVALLACVGPGTAHALQEELGLQADVIPDVATTAALGAVIPPGAGRVLLPRADIASPILPELLRDRGYDPVGVIAYRTGRPPSLSDEVLAELRAGRIDAIAVASPSTARNLVALAGDALGRTRIVSIGPVTSATCRELDLPVAREADPHTIEGLVEALGAAVADA